MTPAQPLVSIIIPTRNRRDLLPYAVQSAQQQTYSNVQIVIHDNNSTDGTPEIVQGFLKDARIEYHRIDHDLTMTENWSGAFSKVRGDYVVRLDDDNILLPDFVASALQEIERLRLDVMMYSPLLIHPRDRLLTLFDASEQETVILSAYQWLYCEYFAYTDTNYALYRTSLVRSLAPTGDVYTTSLPDRFLNYRCMDAMQQRVIRVGLNPSLKGITRFDNLRPKVTELRYVNYAHLNGDEVAKNLDCHHNYPMHRMLTVTRMLDQTTNPKLALFFDTEMTAPALRVTVMRMGHIYSLFRARSLREAALFGFYAFRIGWALITHPRARIEHYGVRTHLLNLLAKTVRYYLRSILRKRDAHAEQPNMTPGNKRIESVLHGAPVAGWTAPALHGKLSDALRTLKTP